MDHPLRTGWQLLGPGRPPGAVVAGRRARGAPFRSSRIYNGTTLPGAGGPAARW